MPDNELRFRVASHLLHDLGLNLYTSLSRVLVEFVANAHDADAARCWIELDASTIQAARARLKGEFQAEMEIAKGITDNAARAAAIANVVPLGERTLPDDIVITITDNGHGMSRDDLAEKFLVAGRRRRGKDDRDKWTPGNRLVMGRKGVGKLAGFGVAHLVQVSSRKDGEAHATRITLDYDRFKELGEVIDFPVDEERVEDGDGLSPKGTRVTLAKLVYESTRSKTDTLSSEIGEHFAAILPAEFAIFFNGNPVLPAKRKFAFAWPSPGRPANQLIPHTTGLPDEEPFTFQYRIRFTERGKHLDANQRGVRIYANRRLASAPSLLDLTTGMHGFRNTSYLDGICYADFIDQDRRDYIATDRQSLRWEVPRLELLRQFLTDEMLKATTEYQKLMDTETVATVKNDPVTRDIIKERKLPAHKRKVALKLARIIASEQDDGIRSPEYRAQLTLFIDALAQGEVMQALGKLSAAKHPNFHEVVQKITELTGQEAADFMRYVEGRLEGIASLEKIFREQDFKKTNNEAALHALFEKNPWLIDPAFATYVSSDVSERAMQERLAKELKIGDHPPPGYSPNAKGEQEEMGTNLRPDLVFLLGGSDRSELIVVELKAPNTPLHHAHLAQLEGYMETADEWLSEHYPDRKVRVRGELIGSRKTGSQSAEVKALNRRIKKDMPHADWRVRDLAEVLKTTERVHKALLDMELVHKQAVDDEDDIGEDPPPVETGKTRRKKPTGGTKRPTKRPDKRSRGSR
jgi:Molecular chaperone, HSP90 family